MNCSYLFSSRKIIQIRTVEDSTRAGQKLHCKIIVSSRREVNASCSCVLFYLLQLCEMALSRYFSVYTNLVISVEIQIFFSVYTNLVISVEIQIFSLFPLSTAEPPTHKNQKTTPQTKQKLFPLHYRHSQMVSSHFVMCSYVVSRPGICAQVNTQQSTAVMGGRGGKPLPFLPGGVAAHVYASLPSTQHHICLILSVHRQH